MKRTISLLLILVIVIGLISSIPITSSAAAVSDLKFTLNSDGKSYTVEARNESVTGTLVIPSTFAGLPVNNVIGFDSCINLTAVTIPNSVVTIGGSAFSGCKQLNSITIPNSVKSIGQYAFSGCEALRMVTLPNNLTTIEKGMFYGSGIVSLRIPSGVTSIGERVFFDCENLSSIIIPDSVKQIGPAAFQYCENIKSISIPYGVTNIAGFTFSDCYNLTSITLPESLTSISESAFAFCEKLESVILPNNITHIGDDAFFSCDSLVSITIPRETIRIGETAFYSCDNLTCILLQNKITNIGWGAFLECKKLKTTYYAGTAIQWNNVNIDECNDNLFSNVILNYNVNRPIPPVLSRISNTTTGVMITWGVVSGAKNYRVYRRGAGEKTWTYLGTVNSTNYIDAKMTSGQYWRYTVRAVGTTGLYSDFDSIGLFIKYMATPKLTAISNASKGIYLKWNAVAGATNGYRVYRRGAGSTYWTYLGTVKSTQAVDVGVKDASGNYFRYTVIADGGYYSAFDTTGLYLKRLANPTLTSAVSSSAGITVKWGAVKGTTGYYVYRKTANSSWVRIAAVGGTNNTTYLDKTARKGVTYTYTVRAVYGATTSAYNSGISCYDKY